MSCHRSIIRVCVANGPFSYSRNDGIGGNIEAVNLDAADTMFLLADRFLAEGVIDEKTYDLLTRKYPIA